MGCTSIQVPPAQNLVMLLEALGGSFELNNGTRTIKLDALAQMSLLTPTSSLITIEVVFP